MISKENILIKRGIIINFIKKNPKTTYNEIREKIKLHPERYFKKGLKEAFEKAKIPNPRNFKIKTKKEKQKIIIKFIKKNPKAGGQTISKQTKINISSVFKNIQEAYQLAKIEYPRNKSYKLSANEKRKLLINEIKKNPEITIPELIKKTKAYPNKLFGKIENLYKQSGINKITGNEKRRRKVKKKIINYIQGNPLATQREINKNCKTHVQEIFKKGIYEAYKKAEIKYPFERTKLYGTSLKHIKQRAKDFEEEIAINLSGYGNVNRLVKTKRGIADIIFERKNKKIIIEIKDYQCKDISISQINQLNKYLEDCDCNNGVLICHKKPKKDTFLIDKNKIIILEKQELAKIPKLF